MNSPHIWKEIQSLLNSEREYVFVTGYLSAFLSKVVETSMQFAAHRKNKIKRILHTAVQVSPFFACKWEDQPQVSLAISKAAKQKASGIWNKISEKHQNPAKSVGICQAIGKLVRNLGIFPHEVFLLIYQGPLKVRKMTNTSIFPSIPGSGGRGNSGMPINTHTLNSTLEGISTRWANHRAVWESSNLSVCPWVGMMPLFMQCLGADAFVNDEKNLKQPINSMFYIYGTTST